MAPASQSPGMQRKQSRAIPTANLPDAYNLFDGTPYPTPGQDDPDFNAFMEIVIYEGCGQGQGFHGERHL